MKIYFDEMPFLPSLLAPLGLAIGTFDGVHLGHQMLCAKLKRENNSSIVITFKDPPYNFFHPDKKIPLILSLEHKLHLLEDLGVDVVVVFSFDAKMANLSFDQFLLSLKRKCNFSHLYLGQHASFGKDKTGQESSIKELSRNLGFQVSAVSPICEKMEKISSTKIREAIDKGDFIFVKRYLGRAFSYYFSDIASSVFQQTADGFLCSLSMDGLCLPPSGKYPASLSFNGETILSEIVIDKEKSILQMVLPKKLLLKERNALRVYL